VITQRKKKKKKREGEKKERRETELFCTPIDSLRAFSDCAPGIQFLFSRLPMMYRYS